MPKAEILVVGLHHAYQWREALRPSPLEREQRRRFRERIQQNVHKFQPNIIADETPDSDNPELLGLLPISPVQVDISQARKQARGFTVERSIHFPCPYVDAIRERYWRLRLYHLIKAHSNPRVLMFVGALHLKWSYIKPITFPDLLTRAGYTVTTVNLYDEDGWDHSWTHDWVHPVTPTTGSYDSQCCVRSGVYQERGRCERKTYWNELPLDRESN
jgi:hypothetical protein